MRGGWANSDGTIWMGGLPPNSNITLSLEGERIPDQWVSSVDDTTYLSEEEAESFDVNDIDGLNIPIRNGIENLRIGSSPSLLFQTHVSVYTATARFEIQSQMTTDSIQFMDYHQEMSRLG